MNEGLTKAIKIAGSQKALAKAITEKTGRYVSHQAVQQWCAKGTIPMRRITDVLVALNFQVTAQSLRPDLFVHQCQTEHLHK